MQENEPKSLALVNDLHVAATAKLVEALVQSENRMRLRLDLLTEVVFEIDADRQITFLNKAWLAVGGGKIEAARGKSLLSLFILDDQPLIMALLDSVTAENSSASVTCRIATPDRRECWVEVGAVPMARGGWVGTMRDVTQSKHSMEQLQLLSLVANYTDNFVIITDERGLVRWVNRSFSEFTGYPLEDIFGKSPGSVLQGPGTDPKEVIRLREHIRARKSVTSEILNYTRAGKPYWSTIHLTPIFDDDSKLDSYIAVQSNTTAMHTLYLQLAEEKSKAEAANKAKSQFLSNVSHEIRTPLNAVIGFLNLLDRTGLNGTQTGYVDKMGSASRHLLRLINDILDFSKIEAGMMEVDIHPFRLGDMMRDVSDFVLADCERKGLAAVIDTAGLDDWHLVGDAQRLLQIILNLAGNAVKFTASGQVRISVTPVSVSDHHAEITFSVADTGIGLDEDQIDYIFKEFSQAEASTTRRFGGTGLGLSISQRLTRLMGGHITVQSTPGLGSDFRFTLTFDRAGAPLLPAPTEASGTLGPRLSGLCILAVEDNEINQMVAKELLVSEGAEIVLAENGKVACERVHATPEAFDLILMDLQMPVMDGFDATRCIHSRHPEIPIIAMTANISPDDVAQTAAAGMCAHIGKPFDVDALVAAIRRHARKALRPAEHAPRDGLLQLRGLLAASDMDALDLFDTLQSHPHYAGEPWLAPVATALDEMDFDAALAALPDPNTDALP